MPTLEEINRLSAKVLAGDLEKCCGSQRWLEKMLAARPFKTETELFTRSEEIWFGLTEKDWLEAFEHHPKIGDLDSLKKKFASTSVWASNEQAGVQAADEELLKKFAQANADYEEKMGFIFIICATGRSAGEMFQALQLRLQNDRQKEMRQASVEQSKITKIRLEKLLKS